MEVTVVSCLKDNYAYLLRAAHDDRAAVVDASEAGPVLAALDRLGLRLRAILSTHHHADHVGGNAELARRFPGLEVVASAHDQGRIPAQTRSVRDGEEIEVVGLRFRCLMVPGHTLGAVAYYGEGAVFTGDTLFAAGCGRLFEGTPAMLHESLNGKLAALPGETLVYCGHEYTAKNLQFAAYVEPQNGAVAARAKHVAELRARGEPTVPSTLREERATNPFLRVAQPEIRAHFAAYLPRDAAPDVVLGALRAAKDAF